MTKYKYSRGTFRRNSIGSLEYDGWIGGKPYFFASKVIEVVENDLLAEAPTKQGKKVKEIKLPHNLDHWFGDVTEALNGLLKNK